MSRSHAGCQGLGKESDFIPDSEELFTGQEGDGCANRAVWKVCREEEEVFFQVVWVSPLCVASGMAPPAQALSFGVSFHPHIHPTEDPVVTTIPTTA